MKIRRILPFSCSVLFACLLAQSAAAHTFGAQGAGFADGWLHPLTGADHVLAMVAVGIWAAQSGGRACWQVPLAFLLMMSAGAGLGRLGLPVAMLEVLIAGSVVGLGLLIGTSVRVSVRLSILLVSAFALLHGYAHGLEIPETAGPLDYAAGFLLATACLHGLGVGLGLLARRSATVTRLGGAAIAFAGVYLLAGF